MTDIVKYLEERPYPGRGILLGSLPSGVPVCAYFIMGRSENSRNRVFEATEDGIRTRAFDESKMKDPSLIIYNPVRRIGRGLIVTNGDQTDTICGYLLKGTGFDDALRIRKFEPDAPNYTPRISGLLSPDGSYKLSILKSTDGDPAVCQRFFFEYSAPKAGLGHFISTYEGFGEPVPSFSGEPVAVSMPEMTVHQLAAALWYALDKDNRVSLYAEAAGETAIINKNV